MSGGVDSTIAAYILKNQGHEIVGVNFNFIAENCEPENRMGELHEPNQELSEISEKLGIKIISRDFSIEFREKVITSFVHDYEEGITPNPCALCNATMKFDALLRLMKEEDADMVATGHYANIVKIDNCSASVVDVNYCIKKSGNLQKDQSYMLYRLSQDQLSHIVFPLANMYKDDVRKIAAELGLKVATKKDSQDVCFINDDYAEFIKEFELGKGYKEKIAKGELSLAEIEKFPFFRKGEFVDENGVVLGYHKGIINYTIGQRKGLNIAFGERKFVKAINVEKNQVVLSDNESLKSSDFKIYDIVFSGKTLAELNGKCTYNAKLRYRHEGTACDIDFTSFDYDNQIKNGASLNNFAVCHLSEPVRAITNGQAAVFYDDKDRIMFGGRILCD